MQEQAAKADLSHIEQARSGDTKAFDALTARYYGGVLLLLKKRIGNTADAEDLAQQTFAKVFENLNSYSSEYAFSTWVYSIAHNCCVDFLRKRRVGSAIPIDRLVEDESFNSRYAQQNPEEDMIAEQSMALASQLLGRLKPHYRRIVELRYFKEYAYEEIAAELNMPIGTVKTHLFRAKEQLMRMMVLRPKGKEGKSST
ncbi:MAG: sigma-70 family RNA polymerase sigma factor [Prevotellaceae bacterium]|jgi:RNA polymerase sigma-70 factor (ECF subfamily)|nr:sigma-70 family RNA polymerase sigma factor [Prevotellaceae bacterium]